MNFKTTYILFAIFAVLLGVFGLTQFMGLKSSRDKTAWVFRSLNDGKTPVRSEDIQTLEIDRAAGTPAKLVFYRSDDGWKLRDPEVRLEGYQVDRVIDQLIGARKEEKADVSSDLGQFGLDKPSVTVTMTRKESDQQWTLKVGKESETGGASDKVVYVLSSDQPKQPMAVKRSEIDSVFKNVSDFRSKSLLAESAFDLTAVDLEAPKHAALDLAKNADKNEWHFVKPAYGAAEYEGEPAPPGPATSDRPVSGVRGLLEAITSIRVESDKDFGTTDAKDSELADKGLEKGKETLRIAIKRIASSPGQKKETVADALLIGKKADAKGEKVYARLESDRNIVAVPAKQVNAVLKVLDDPTILRNRDLVQLDTTKVDAIDIQTGQGLVKLRHVGTSAAWKIYGGGKVLEADNDAVQGLLSALTAKRQIKEFPAAKNDKDLGLDKPAVVVSLWENGIKPEEKKDDKKDAKGAKKDDKSAKKNEPAEPVLKEPTPTVKLAFGKKDKDVVYVRRDVGKETVRVAVPAALLTTAGQERVAYLDRKLPSFGWNSEVSRFTLTAGGHTYEVERVKDPKAKTEWQFKQPRELAGKPAETSRVDALLSKLRDLQADKLIAEKAAPKELAAYGLEHPAAQATVTVDKSGKKPEQHVYLFGKESDDRTGIYAKQGERDLVFTVPKNSLEALENSLRDTTLYSFDPAKVKSLKLAGWQDIVGKPFILDLDRKAANNWVAKNPADFQVDSAKVEGFVAGLPKVRIVRFADAAAGLKSVYKFEPRDGGLDIVLTIDGQKEPYALTIGGQAGFDGYYARSNKHPGDVFVLPRAAFDQAKSRPAYFQK